MARILVVEDDPDIRLLMARVLQLAGHDIELCADGMTALDVLERGEPPELILLDVQMPHVDGWEVLARVRARGGLDGLPVVLCTVKSSAADRSAGWDRGADGYVTKPFAIADLVTTITTVLERTPEERVAWRAAQAADAPVGGR